jgi:hypothetical protein
MEKSALWSSVAIIAFLLLFFVVTEFIKEEVGIYFLFDLRVLDLTLLALATFRLVHLFTYDKVFGFVREYFYDHSGSFSRPTQGFNRLVYEFLECLWCTGIWSALVTLTLYSTSFAGQLFVFVLAIAGAGSLLQVISLAIASHDNE